MVERGIQTIPARAEGKMPLRETASLPAPSDGTNGVRGMEAHPAWPMISRLPVMLDVRIPLRGFKLRDLLKLSRGETIESAWQIAEDVPLHVGELQIGWGEFEVAGQQMALRLTSLA